MKKTINLLKILISGTVLVTTMTFISSCQSRDDQKDISFIEVDKDSGCEAFFIPEDISNITTKDLLQINQDITINDKVLKILQKIISPNISYQDFYLQNNALLFDEYDKKIDYQQFQNIQATVYSSPKSKIIKGSFDIDCNVLANKSKISLEELFNGFEIVDAIPIEDDFNIINGDPIDFLSKDEWVKKHIFELLRLRLEYLDLNQLNFSFSKDSELLENEVWLEVLPSTSGIENIKNNLFNSGSIYKTKIQVKNHEHDFFDLSKIDFTDFFKSNVEINTLTPDLIYKDEVINSILAKFPKSEIAKFLNLNKNLENKYKISDNDVIINFIDVPEKDSYIEEKTIQLNVSLESKYFFNSALASICVLAVEKIDDLSLIEPDKEILVFDFESKTPTNVELNEFLELSKPNASSELPNHIYKLITNSYKATQSKLYYDYEIELLKPVDNMDFSKGKIIDVNVRATTFSKKLKNSFSFQILGVVKNCFTDISDVVCESENTYSFLSENSEGIVSKAEFEKIFKNEELNSFISTEISIIKKFTHLSSADFEINADFNNDLDYFEKQNIEITISSSTTSRFISGSFKTKIFVKAEFKKYNLANFDTSKNSQTVVLIVPDSKNIILSEAVRILFMQKNFIKSINNALAKNSITDPIFGLDYTINVISLPRDISIPGGFIKYQIKSLEKSKKLIGENFSTIQVIGKDSQDPVAEKISYYSSETNVAANDDNIELTVDNEKNTKVAYRNRSDFAFTLNFDYIQNKLWDKLNETISMEFLLNNGIISEKEHGLSFGVKNFSFNYTNISYPGASAAVADGTLMRDASFTNRIASGDKLKISAQLIPDALDIVSSGFHKVYNNSTNINLKLNKECINFLVVCSAYIDNLGEISYMPKLAMINNNISHNFMLQFSEGPIKTDFNPANNFPVNMATHPYKESSYEI